MGNRWLEVAQKEETAGDSQPRSQGICGVGEMQKWLFQAGTGDSHPHAVTESTE